MGSNNDNYSIIEVIILQSWILQVILHRIEYKLILKILQS